MSGAHGHGEENPHAGQGSVLLDIGGDVGALVVTMPAELLGEEIEVTTGQEPPGHHRPHVAVVPRPVPGSQGRSVPSLVFPELVEGSYALVPKGTDDVRLRVDVRGGEVTSADWPV
ncbi:MAG TPA: hypothetical protein PLZ93_05860 [Nocardioides sp.]|uniref:hypothetical protein n=1 Tax=uncultured Nocardioides sp. TaxID=198441 RepID=UPI000EBB3DEA|nr:hypothetical protein [uncultured Nocardioides sp.]HCB03652.1 hypothetical protein [Nocardioides sp.]HRD59593.1 hypothetical protein [Nocardioides sp.]HRI95116.1 hypothetical protein [Nocardioides sp.]HRK45646.1 hypothetical protein [Nocardioides sp.]